MFAAYNPRRIGGHEYDELRWSIRTFGYVQLVVVNKRTRKEGWPPGSKPTIVGGHQGVKASEDEGLEALPIRWVDLDAVLEKKLNLILNRIGGEFIADQVETILRELKEAGDDLSHVGFREDEIEAFLAGKSVRRSIDRDAARRTLRERFVVPPFTVLDSRQGYWLKRRRAWLDLGVKGALDTSKDPLLFASDSGRDPGYYKQKRETERKLGRKLTTAEFQANYYERSGGAVGLGTTGDSGFDPVLCELIYRWFSPPGGLVLDPFAGGPVGGIIAAAVGRKFLGIDVRDDLLKRNRALAKTFFPQGAKRKAPRRKAGSRKRSKAPRLARATEKSDAEAVDLGTVHFVGAPLPVWKKGDALAIEASTPKDSVDLVWTSPPFFDLERYTDDPRDLSNRGNYELFVDGLEKTAKGLFGVLRPDRFAAVIVGEIRAESPGFYRGLVPDTIRAFSGAGFGYYNEAIFVTLGGSLPIRTIRPFEAARKLGRLHQTVLVFSKGDPVKATKAIGPIEFGKGTDENLAADLEPPSV